MVMCLKLGANDLHIVQLVPLLQYNAEWFILTQVVLEKRPLNEFNSTSKVIVNSVMCLQLETKRRNLALSIFC